MQIKHRAGLEEFFRNSLNRDGDYPEGINKDDFDQQNTVAGTREDVRAVFVMNSDMVNLIERHSQVAFQVTITLAFPHRSLTSS